MIIDTAYSPIDEEKCEGISVFPIVYYWCPIKNYKGSLLSPHLDDALLYAVVSE